MITLFPVGEVDFVRNISFILFFMNILTFNQRGHAPRIANLLDIAIFSFMCIDFLDFNASYHF